ncbi:hypothetical protein ABCL16_003422 [Vibrio parahaemolyticus]
MKIVFKANEGGTALNPLAMATKSEVIQVLELGSGFNLSTQQKLVAQDALDNLIADTPNTTIRDVIGLFKSVEALTLFANRCELVFLAGGDLAPLFQAGR